MPRMQILVSSTDPSHSHQYFETLIRELGHQSVVFGPEDLTYGANGELLDNSHAEVSSCHVLVAIFGNCFDYMSSEESFTATQRQLLQAIELQKQIIVLIKRDLLSEYRAYRANRILPAFHPRYNHHIYQFLEEYFAQSDDNACSTYETVDDIAEKLKADLSDRLRRSMIEGTNLPPANSTTKINTNAIHPAWDHLGKLLNLPHPLQFRTDIELTLQLQHHGFHDDRMPWEDRFEWSRSHKGIQIVLRAEPHLFSGHLATLVPEEQWSPSLITLEHFEIEI